MSAPCVPLRGWYRVKGALSFAHRWHTKEQADGREWVEADCAIGIVVNRANLEEAKPGHAICVQCREIMMVTIQDELVAIARAAAAAPHLPGRSGPQFGLLSWEYCERAQAIVKQLPLEEK